MLAKPLDHVRNMLSGKQKELATDASGLLNPQAQAIVDAFSSFGPLPFEILTPDEARKQPGPDRRGQEGAGRPRPGGPRTGRLGRGHQAQAQQEVARHFRTAFGTAGLSA